MKTESSSSCSGGGSGSSYLMNLLVCLLCIIFIFVATYSIAFSILICTRCPENHGCTKLCSGPSQIIFGTLCGSWKKNNPKRRIDLL